MAKTQNAQDMLGKDDASDATASSTIDVKACLARMRKSTGVRSDASLATYLEIPYSTIASWKRRNSIPLDVFISASERTGASLDGLILGKISEKASKQPILSDVAFEYAVKLALSVQGIEPKNFPDELHTLIRRHFSTLRISVEVLRTDGVSEEEIERRLQDVVGQLVLEDGQL